MSTPADVSARTGAARYLSPAPEPYDFSVVLGGPLFQLARRTHLSGDALELLRRRLIASCTITWLPLLILSGMLLPLSEGPEWMRAVATVNPVNWVVQAERALLAGQFGQPEVLWGAVAAVAVAAVGLAVGIRAMRRSS